MEVESDELPRQRAGQHRIQDPIHGNPVRGVNLAGTSLLHD